MIKLSDIPQFTRSAAYKIIMSWDYLEEWLKGQQDDIGLDLSPEFQRDHVWTEIQEIRYVEYIVRGGKTGRDIHFNGKGWMKDFDGPLVLVDGKQRVKAVLRFLRGEIPAFGYYYSDFAPRSFGLCGPDFTIHVNDLKTDKEVMQWYVDMNAGGTVHTNEEIQKVKDMIAAEEGK